MKVEQLALATGLTLNDAFLSMLLEQTLPRSWRTTVASWLEGRQFVPFNELVKRIVEKDAVEKAKTKENELTRKPEQQRTEPTQSNNDQLLQVPTQHGNLQQTPCFYCFRTNHNFRNCRYLQQDIEANKTHDSRSQFSCVVTYDRKLWMVKELEAYIKEVMNRTGPQMSMAQNTIRASGNHSNRERSNRSMSRPRRSPSRARFNGSRPGRSRSRPDRSRSRPRSNISRPGRSQSRPRRSPSRSRTAGFQRSRSVFRLQDASKISRLSRSHSVFRGGGGSFPLQNGRRSLSFERGLRSSP